MKIVINKAGIGLYKLDCAFVMEYAKRKGIELYVYKVVCDYGGNYKFTPYKPDDIIDDLLSLRYFRKPLDKAIFDTLNPDEESEFRPQEIGRTDPILVALVEDYSKLIGDEFNLTVVEVPDDVSCYIDHVGCPPFREIVRENHRVFWA
jgi:hypothetical protein